MPSRVVDTQQEQAKRDLRRRIGRLRRRVDGRIRAGGREAHRLMSWRTYVSRYSGGATATAFGIGLALAAGLSGPRLLRWFALRLVRQGTRSMGSGAWKELASVWADSATAKKDVRPTEGDDA